jgi:hypothetical protein
LVLKVRSADTVQLASGLGHKPLSVHTSVWLGSVRNEMPKFRGARFAVMQVLLPGLQPLSQGVLELIWPWALQTTRLSPTHCVVLGWQALQLAAPTAPVQPKAQAMSDAPLPLAAHVVSVLASLQAVSFGTHTLHAKSPVNVLQPFGQLWLPAPVPCALHTLKVFAPGQPCGSPGSHTLHAKSPDSALQPFGQL